MSSISERLKPRASGDSGKRETGNFGTGSAVDRGEEEPEPERQWDEKKEDVPPNGGIGWLMIACVSTINGYVKSLPGWSGVVVWGGSGFTFPTGLGVLTGARYLYHAANIVADIHGV
jgi:hypothetical protein